MSRPAIVASEPLAEGASDVIPAHHFRFEWFDVDQDPQTWDDRVRAAGQGVFHTSGMLAAHMTRGVKRRGVVVHAGGRQLALVGGLWRQDRLGTQFETLSFLSPPQGGDRHLLRDLLAWLCQQGVGQIRFGSYDCGIEHHELTGAHCGQVERLEFVWRLDLPEQARFQRLKSNHKRKLKGLLQRDLRLREITRLRRETMTLLRVRWAQRRGRPMSLGEIVELYRYYGVLHRHLTRAGIARLYGLFDERNRLLSIVYMLEAPEAAYYMIGASSPAGYQVGASVRLFWDLGCLYARQGRRCLNLGGVPLAASAKEHDEHGVFRFKTDFGIEPVRRTTLTYRQPDGPQGAHSRDSTIVAA